MNHPDFDSKQEIQEKWSSVDINHIQSVLQRPTTEKTIEKIEDAGISKSDSILEVGCGWGRLITQIEGAEQKFGIDLSPDMLRQQELLFDNQIEKVNGDADSLPFQPNTFDLIYSVRVLQYVTNINHAISEMKRVLVDGGKLVIILPNKYNPYNYFTYHTKLYSPREIIDAFNNNGFTDISHVFFNFSPPEHFVELLEGFSSIPFFKRLGGLYAVTGTAESI